MVTSSGSTAVSLAHSSLSAWNQWSPNTSWFFVRLFVCSKKQSTRKVRRPIAIQCRRSKDISYGSSTSSVWWKLHFTVQARTSSMLHLRSCHFSHARGLLTQRLRIFTNNTKCQCSKTHPMAVTRTYFDEDMGKYKPLNHVCKLTGVLLSQVYVT